MKAGLRHGNRFEPSGRPLPRSGEPAARGTRMLPELNLDETKPGLWSRCARGRLLSCTLLASAEMDEIQDVAEPRGLATAEDNPHGLFGKQEQRCLGALGCRASQSFHATKKFTCGEGDALLINDPP